jgi:putative FmdB family regulatory protein
MYLYYLYNSIKGEAMLYDYYCANCQKEKEVNHGITESPVIKCDCGEKMKIKISTISGIHFKGQGFTKTSR